MRAAHAGVITEIFGEEGDNVDVGAPFVSIDTSAAAPAGTSPTSSAHATHAEKRLVLDHGVCEKRAISSLWCNV